MILWNFERRLILMKHLPSFTRCDFLKLSAAGVLGVVLAESGIDRVLAAEEGTKQ